MKRYILPVILLVAVFYLGKQCGNKTEIIEHINRPIINIKEIEKEVKKEKETIQEQTVKINTIKQDLIVADLENNDSLQDTLKDILIIEQDLQIRLQSNIINKQDTIINELKLDLKQDKKNKRKQRWRNFGQGFATATIIFIGGNIYNKIK